MADKEQKSKGPSAGGSAVVMVEKTSSQRRHKEFRPTALSDDTPVELRHKRSRAPAVPSVAEEYKDLPENADIREQKESILAMPSQKPRRVPSEKSSKREKSPKAIPMTPLGVDVQKSDFVSPAQPIPAPPSVHLVAPTDVADDKDSMDNDDSITEEITDLRVAESSNKEWGTTNGSQKCVPENQETEETAPLPRTLVSEITNKIENETETVNKKEDPVQLVPKSDDKLPLQRKAASGTINEGNLNTRSVAWMLDRRASVGPCFRKTLPYGEPSGITICLPKKSVKSFNENMKPSKSGGININMSKRCLDINTKLLSDYEMKMKTDRVVIPRKETKIEEGNCANFLDNLKGKLDNWRGRIKHVLHM